jgi:hypothetical protein
MTFLRHCNPLIEKGYDELVKDSPRPAEARIYGLCVRLSDVRPQAYPQALWISIKSFSKQITADHC